MKRSQVPGSSFRQEFDVNSNNWIPGHTRHFRERLPSAVEKWSQKIFLLAANAVENLPQLPGKSAGVSFVHNT